MDTMIACFARLLIFSATCMAPPAEMPANNAFLARQPARRLFGFTLADEFDAVYILWCIDFWQILIVIGPFAYARDLRTFLRLYPDRLDRGILLLQVAGYAD
jgi:hypothetical protein